jgi:hypothetical protein
MLRKGEKSLNLPHKNVTLTVFFIILTLIAAVTVVSLQQTAADQTQTRTVGTYQSKASVDYTATVQPSTIYGDKTQIKPSDGAIYTKLTSKIDLVLTYTFTSTLQTNPTITYNVNTTLKTDAWQYQTSATPKSTTTQTTIQLALPTFVKAEIEQTKARIDNETGVTSGFYSQSQPYYILEIQPTFTVDAQTENGAIHQTFRPVIAVNSTHTSEGDVIIIADLTQTGMGALTLQETQTNQDVINQRYASYILIATSLVGLGYSTLSLHKQQQHATPKTITNSKLLEPYKHLIIEATENVDATTSTIKVSSIAELAKAAETLNKPILHIKNSTQDVLCIIEGTTKYQYTISTPDASS